MSYTPPLVSIIIYNYNYGRFLRECIESAVTQSYPNIEILFSDNASTDDSWEIALKFSQQYPDKIFLARNHQNFGPTANLKNCMSNIHGRYFMILCSDDKLDSNCVERAVAQLEAHPDACMTLMHRYILSESGQVTNEAPFYDQSCKIFPPMQAAVYMMASVNPTLSQILYRTDYHTATKNFEGASGHANRFLGNRVLDFTLSCLYPIIYLHTPLVYHRVHALSDTNLAKDHLIQIIGPYFLNIEFCEIARSFHYPEVYERWEASVEKLATLALRYAADAFMQKNEALAKRYFYLAGAFFPEIESNETFKEFSAYWCQQSTRAALVKALGKNKVSLQRTTSYPPPEGSELLSDSEALSALV